MTTLELSDIDGIGPVTKQKLVEAGITDGLDLLVRGASGVSDATGLDLEKASNLVTKARIKLVELGTLEKDFITATEIYEKRKNIKRISTGSNNFDDLLGGGIETKAITEVYGEYGSGKTQLCHTLCVMVQSMGGAIYIDTEGTFRPERIRSIAEAKGIDPDKALENIIVAKAFNSAHQELLVEGLTKIIEENNTKLVVVDSGIAHFRAEYLGRGELSGRQQRLNKHMHLLLRIAETFDLAVIVTNQVQSSPDSFFGDPIRAVGGNVVAHTSTYRIYLKRSGKNRIARFVDSPSHAEREIIYKLEESGISDVEEKKK